MEKVEEKEEEEEKEEDFKLRNFFIYTMWAFHENFWAKEDTFWLYLLSQSPPARKPMPRVRKPNLH
ncbi:hypothetical protein E2C01_096427 [Portunus trituberculatus]|uniref:Uncharacterized protein n=1 Tax=Portunus trituberculatus TaxID=210409 RepID=A0A5B7JVK8_PORTR|nr:hypothetical protein [Portunus trituberculatus]